MTPGSDLRSKAVAGISWLSILYVIELTVGAGTIVLLARLLQPADFGIFAIALIFKDLLVDLTKLGLGEAIIQRRVDPLPYVDDAWVFGLLRHVALGVGLVLFAPYAAGFFDEPNAVGLMYVIAFGIAIQGLKNPVLFILQKDMKFKEFGIVNHCRFWVETITVIAMALWLKSAYALAFGFVANSVAWIIVSYLIHPYRPKLRLDMKRIRELTTYGKWITLEQATLFVSSNAESIVLGRLLSSIPLGLYQMGRNFAFYTDRFVQSIVKPVMFPLYSEIQGDPAKVRNWMHASFTAAIILAGFIAAGVYAVADSLLPMLLGDKWTPAIGVVKVLIVASGLHMLIFSMSDPIFKGLGRPDVSFKFQALKAALILVLSIYAIITYGLIGAAYALLATLLLMVPVWLFYLNRVARQPLGFLVPAALVGLAPFAVIVAAQAYIAPALDVNSLVSWALAAIALCLLSIGLGYLFSPDIRASVKLAASIRTKAKLKV